MLIIKVIQPLPTAHYLLPTALALSCIFYIPTAAQVFRTVPGPISSTSSDSRSVNFLDVNNDGWEDVFISNGLKGGQPDLLYINDGTGQLVEAKDAEIGQVSNPSDGASFADYNNDGFIDGVVSSWYGAEDMLYINDGNGKLVYNAGAGLAPGSFAETAAFGDYDQDGWLDLYITNSGGDKHNFLYRNLKNGKFERIVDHILIRDTKPSRGAVWVDVNNDGITDLFVANEENTANDLFIGKGGGAFEKFNRGGIVVDARSSMTGSWGDIDNDGDLDLFVGNAGYYVGQKNQLYKNSGDGFTEVTGDPTVEAEGCTYGSAFGDYDNDGDLDLLVMNGFCNSGLRNSLFENQGDGSFVDVSHLLSSNGNNCSYGGAWGDVNNDGFLDLVVANCQNSATDAQPPNAFMLNLGNDHHWLKIKLRGVQSNAGAIGARISIKATIHAQEVWQMRELSTQSGYAGQNSLVVHFGLGNAAIIDSLIILWPAGGMQVLEQVSANQQLIVKEDIANAVEQQLTASLSMQVFPNPLQVEADSLQVSFFNPDMPQRGRLSLHDIQGKMVWKKQLTLEAGQNRWPVAINDPDMVPGTYELIWRSKGKQISRKIVIQ